MCFTFIAHRCWPAPVLCNFFFRVLKNNVYCVLWQYNSRLCDTRKLINMKSHSSCVFTSEVTLATGSYVSYAGVTQILYYEKSSDRVYSINGGWNTPLDGDPSQIPKVHTSGDNGASVLVPGFIAGIADAATKFAKFPLKTLFEPALYFAENGFKLSSGMAASIKLYYNDITLLRTTQGICNFLPQFIYQQ